MEEVLDKSLISDTSICNLLLRIGPGRLDVAMFSVVHDNSLIYRKFTLGADGEDELRSLENTIYDNPLLLGEFRRTYCIVDPGNTMALPAEIDSAGERDKIFKAIHPDFKGEVMTSPAGTHNALLTFGVQADLARFLHRTFHGVEIRCHLSPLCSFFASRGTRGNTTRMICNFRPDAVDAIVLNGTDLMLANTFRFNAPMDAVYYIMAVRQRLELNPESDELLLAGDQSVRETIVPVLRRFISRVMPVIFPPQMFRTGKDSLRAPFDLIITPLCE